MGKVLHLLISGFLLLLYLPGLCQVADSAQVNEENKAQSSTETKYFLVLDKPGKISRLRFYTGNTITFKLTGEKQRYSGLITQINKNSFVVWDTEIPIQDVERIKVIKTGSISSGFQFIGRLLKKGGLLFTIIGGGNYLLGTETGGNSLTFLKYTTGAFITGFLITSGSQNRTYKINNKHRLKTIEQFW